MAVKEAVREKPVTPAAYVMPTVRMGQTVDWFMDASGNPKDATMATVLRVSQRCINVVITREDGRHQFYSDVRHISDPSIPENENYSRQGGWDHTTETKRIDEMESRITALEEMFTKR